MEDFWKEKFGYGFEKLTQSEARYLYSAKGQDADSIRNRIAKERQRTSALQSNGADSEAQGRGALPSQLKYSKDGKIQGFTHDGKAYLVVDGIEKGREWGVLLHELGWHVRKALLKDKSFNRLLASIPQKMKGNTRLARQLREAREKVPKDTPKEHINEETAAYFIEANPETTFARMIIAKVKKLLVDLEIIDVTRLNMDDLVALSVVAVRGGAVSKKSVENPYQDVIGNEHERKNGRIQEKAQRIYGESEGRQDRKPQTLGQRLKTNKANISVLLSNKKKATPRPVTREDLRSQEFKEGFGDSLARTDEGVACYCRLHIWLNKNKSQTDTSFYINSHTFLPMIYCCSIIWQSVP